MDTKIYNIELDIYNSCIDTPIEFVQNDSANELSITLFKNGIPFNITNCRATITFAKFDKSVVMGKPTIIDYNIGKLSYVLGVNDIDVAGKCLGTVEIFDENDKRLSSSQFALNIRGELDNGEAEVSSNDVDRYARKSYVDAHIAEDTAEWEKLNSIYKGEITPDQEETTLEEGIYMINNTPFSKISIIQSAGYWTESHTSDSDIQATKRLYLSPDSRTKDIIWTDGEGWSSEEYAYLSDLSPILSDIANLNNDKQDVLTAGNNIKITDGVVSAEGTGLKNINILSYVGTTSNSTITELFIDGISGQRKTIAQNTTMFFRITAKAWDDITAKVWIIEGAIKRGALTNAALVGTPAKTVVAMTEYASSLDILVGTYITNALTIRVQGINAPINWSAQLELI